MSTDASTPDTIVLIHGFWVTPRSWEHWIAHYEAAGYRVLAPAYPGFEVEVEALNADPDADRGRDRARRSSSTSRRSSASSTRRRSSWATPPAARSRRSCSTTASAPPAWRSTRRRPRASRVVPLSQIKATLPGAQEPGQPPPGRRLHARAVALRVHEHVQRGGVARAVRALPHPRVRLDLLGQRAREHPSRPRRHVGRLQERRPRAAAVHLRQRGPPDAADDPALERQALQVRHDHRGQGVRGPPHLLPAEEGWEQIADYALDWALEPRRAAERPA